MNDVVGPSSSCCHSVLNLNANKQNTLLSHHGVDGIQLMTIISEKLAKENNKAAPHKYTS